MLGNSPHAVLSNSFFSNLKLFPLKALLLAVLLCTAFAYKREKNIPALFLTFRCFADIMFE